MVMIMIYIMNSLYSITHTKRKSISKHLVIIALSVVSIAEHIQRTRNHNAIVTTSLDGSNKHNSRGVTLEVKNRDYAKPEQLRQQTPK